MTVGDHQVSAVPRQARAFQGRGAGVVTRSLAAGMDVFLVAVTLVAGYVGVVGLWFLVDPRHFHVPDPPIGLALGADAVLLTFYLTVAWASGGRTYGNRLMGLRVVTLRGERAGYLRAAARAVAYVVFPVGLLWVVVDRHCRSVQDLVLGTSVVYDWGPRPVGPEPGSTGGAMGPA